MTLFLSPENESVGASKGKKDPPTSVKLNVKDTRSSSKKQRAASPRTPKSIATKTPSASSKKKAKLTSPDKTISPKTVAKSATPLPRKSLIPQNGMPCAYKFEKSNDFLGVERTGAGGWFPAVIDKVKKEGLMQSLDIAYWDGTLETIALPNEYFCLLYQGKDHEKSKLFFDDGQLFGEYNPKHLYIGDLVFAFYQNGGSNGSYFRGRVASVGEIVLATPEPVCDIAYDDGEYEVNIPYTRHNNVLKAEDGRKNPEWMYHLQVKIGGKGGTVRSISNERGVSVEFQSARGRLIYEDHSFESVVVNLFEARKTETNTMAISWPIHKDVVFSQPRCDTPVEKTTVEVSTSKRRPIRSAVRKTMEKEARKKPQKTAVKRKIFIEDAVEESDCDTVDDTISQPVDAKEKVYDPLREITPRLNAAYTDALFSSDCLFVSRLLQRSLPIRDPEYLFQGNYATSQVLLARMVETIIHGPQSDAGVRYPDSDKVTCILEYIKAVIKQPNGMQYFLQALTPSFVTDCLEAIFNAQYMHEEDETCSTSGSLERLCWSLHLQIACAELLEVVLKEQLHGALKLSRPELDPVFERALVKDIVQQRRGPKAIFERSVLALAKVFSCHYYKQVGMLSSRASANASNDEALEAHTAREQFLKLTRKAGSVASYLGWLYSSCDSEDAFALARSIGSVMNGELQRSSATNMVPEDEKKNLKLRFLLQFDRKVLPHVRPRLAEKLEVANLYDILFAFGDNVEKTLS
jgi:hypothetical protein